MSQIAKNVSTPRPRKPARNPYRGVAAEGVTPPTLTSTTGTGSAPVVVMPRSVSEPARSAPSGSAKCRRAVSSDERHRMIQEAAYFVAERQQFRADPAWCWLRAEEEIDRRISGK